MNGMKPPFQMSKARRAVLGCLRRTMRGGCVNERSQNLGTHGGGQGRQDDGQQQRQRPEQEGERPDGPPAVILVLEQNGERLTGTAEAEQGNVQFENGTINGETVTLTLTLVGPDGRELALTLQGNVDGDSIAGTMEGGPAGRGGGRGGGGGGPGWQAQRVN